MKQTWWSRWGSNPRPPDCEPGALPVELLPPQNGGEEGIRTLGRGLPYTRFPIVHLRPLGHLSKKRTMAEREGFEPSVTIIATMVFETIPFDHSGTSPTQNYNCLKLVKNSFNIFEDSLAKTSPTTSQRWFNLESCNTFRKEPHAPVFGSNVEKTTRAIRDKTIAPAHIAQGSRVT